MPMRAAPLAFASTLLWLSCTGDHGGHGPTGPIEYFTTSTEGLPEAVPMPTYEVEDGDTVILTAAPVKKAIHGRMVRMLAYNGSVPGPLIKAPQGGRITVRFRNRTGLPSTLHPHGLRLENRFDGTPEVHTVADQDSFDYELAFPDPGPFWYHPHVREAYGIDMGLYGNLLVTPRDSAYWLPVHREIPLLLDDVKMNDTGLAPFRKDQADHVMNGRFGNAYLANGDTDLVIPVKLREVIRFPLTNACNTRVLYVGFHERDPLGKYLNRSVRSVGSDMGRFPRHEYPFFTLMAPGERYVVEKFFFDTSTVYLMHVIARPNASPEFRRLATFKVQPDTAPGDLGASFYRPDTSAHAITSLDSFRVDFSKPTDKRITFLAKADHAHLAKKAHDPNGKGVEWEDHDMGGMANAKTTPANFTWVIRDDETRKENHAIDWSFKRGERVKIRVYNDTAGAHAMPHPLHFHGQRFLVVRINGVPNPETELSWKDTYLVGRGETAEILLDASNPGTWMAHCHIAEHLEASMVFHYKVE
jgi:suppressor of ftsI